MKYLKEEYLETIILDKFVTVKWVGTAIPHYANLGYGPYEQYSEFTVPPSDLPRYSNAIIRVECPICREGREVKYKAIFAYGHTVCSGCAKIKDMTGNKYGHWTVLELDSNRYRKVNSSAYWMCKCDCGTISSVCRSALEKGESRSCGCYQPEAISGDKNWNWNPDITEEERIIGRDYPEYKRWANEVLRRDLWTCQVCGCRENVEAHHLYSYTAYPEYQLDVDYGIALCKEHHKAFHVWLGGYWVACIPSDYDRWLYST